MKRCTKCGVEKPIDQFPPDKQSPDGINRRCKSCMVAYAKEWYEKNKEYAKAQARNYYASHRAEQLAKRKANYLSNRDSFLSRNRQHYISNKEKVLRQTKEYSIAHPERAKKAQSNFRKRYPEKVREWKANWARNHREKGVLYANKRRTEKMKNGGSHTNEEWNDLLAKYENRCLCCGRKDRKLTRDHIIPVALGGSNSIENIQPLCKSCNSKKHTKVLDYRKGGVPS